MDLKWGIMFEFIVEVKCQNVDFIQQIRVMVQRPVVLKMVVNFQFPFRRECRETLSYP